MKKLTEDWKIKKRKSSHCGFKEAIDFKLSSPEKSHSVIRNPETSATPKRKTVSKDYSISKQKTVQNSQCKSKPLVPLRRSSRLTNKFIEKKECIVNSSLPESLTVSASKFGRFSENCFEEKNQSGIDDDGFNLSQWGLPPSIVQAYNARGINSMFQWQYECLMMKNVLDGGNLVFSAPTSAGKTLVAEILILKNVTEMKKKAIMILPFVSVVREKVNYFQEMFENAGIVVDGYMGAHNPPGGFKSVDVAICTIEKANNLVNRLMEEKRLDEVGILVVDELHMLGDQGRGYLLELLLTKLLYNCKRNSIQIQIVGMSATLPNLDVLAFWLGSELYNTDFRPVPLQEMVKVGSVIYDAKSKASSRDLKQAEVTFTDDADHTILLSIETIVSGHGVLIFCPSKNWCENLATSIAKEVYTAGRPGGVADGNSVYNAIGAKLREHLNGSQLNDILLQLRSSPAGLDSVLGLTVPFGVAFHHAGLTFDERDIIEGAFRQGIIKILVATSTLSSGVNLPARRVIIRSPLFCGSIIDVLSYKQMVGRAGRKGIDDEGESILICKESERNIALTLVNSELRPVKSCLLKSGSNNLHSSLKRALIEVIASGVASTEKEVLQYVTCTLLFASLAKESDSSNKDVESSIEKCIEYLVNNDIIFKNEEMENEEILKVTYKPSRLGLAILASGFSPDDALRVLKELQLARRCFVLENDLHILYEVTPPYLSEQMGTLNWMHFLSLWEDLPEEYKRVGELVGVQEAFIGLGIQGRLIRNNPGTAHKMAVHQRFYATLALNDLIQEVPLSVVAKRYDCTRGVLQSLQQSTSTFAGMLTTFCNRLGWNNLELLFSSFQKRVHFGIQQELCDLVRLSTLNAQRARALYNAGFESITSLAGALPEELSLLLCNMGSFESAKQLDGALAEEALQRHEAKRIRITGKAGVSEREAANLIIQEAQNFIQQELGITGIHWKHRAAKKFVKTSDPKVPDQPTSALGPQIDKEEQIEVDSKAITVRQQSISSNGSKVSDDKVNMNEDAFEYSSLVQSNLTSKFEADLPVTRKPHHKHAKRSIGPKPSDKKGNTTKDSSESNILNQPTLTSGHDAVLQDNEVLSCKETSKLNASKITDGNKNLGEDLEEIVSDLEKYPEILRKMYLEESLIKDSDLEARYLSKGNDISNNYSKELLNDTLHENLKDCFLMDGKEESPRKKRKNLSYRKEINSKKSESILLKNRESVVFSDSVTNEDNSSSTVKDSTVKHDQNCRKSKPMNQTFLLVEGIEENLDNMEVIKQEETSNVVSKSFYSYLDDMFCSLLASQKSFAKCEKEGMSLEELNDDEVDNLSFSELLLSQIANEDGMHFTQLFDGEPNISSNGIALNECNTVVLKNNAIDTNDYMLEVVKPPVKMSNLKLLLGNKAVDSQCFNSTKKKSTEKMSFLEGPEFNFMSESRFSFELQNSINCEKNIVEKNSTPITEIKSKAKESLLDSCLSIKNIDFNVLSPLNIHSNSVNSLNKDSLKKNEKILVHQTVQRDKDVISTENKVSLSKAKIPYELTISYENAHSRNETSGDIFESEESFNADYVSSQKVNVKLLSNSNKESSFNAKALKTDNLIAETSGDIFDDSFDFQNTFFDIQTNIISGQNMNENKQEMVNKLKINKICLDSKIIDNFIVNNSEEKLTHPKIRIQEHYKTSSAKQELEVTATHTSWGVKENTDLKVNSIKLEDFEMPMMNTKDPSEFWNSWNPSQDNLPITHSVPKLKANLPAKYSPDHLKDRISPSNTKENLTFDSADNSLFNSFNSDYLSPTPDKPSKSVLRVQVSSRKMSSKNFTLFEKNDSIGGDNFEEFIKQDTSLGNKENVNSQNVSDGSKVILRVTLIADSQLESFLKQTSRAQKFAISVACEKIITKKTTIGPVKNARRIVAEKRQWVVDSDIAVVGLAICYGKDSFYISFSEDNIMADNQPGLLSSEKSKIIQQFFDKNISEHSVFAYDTKSQYKILWQGCDISLKQKCADPSIAAWLLDPTKGQQPMKVLVNNFWPEAASLMKDFDNTAGSLGLQHWSATSAQERAATEAFVTFHLMNKLFTVLKEQQLYQAFTELEMPSVLSFAKMEQNGLGFNTCLATNYQKELQKRQQDIMDKAYQVAGRRFNILSSKEIAKVLFKELKLSPVLAPDSPLINRHLGVGRATRSRKMPPELKTNRECLEKIIHLHPLPKMILDWRRLSFATTKVLMPLLRKHKHDYHFNMDRLYSTCFYYTLTGRVNVHSPNLQFIPRDFNINNTGEECNNHNDVVDEAYHCSDEDIQQYGVSLRNLFIPSKGFVLLAADYSQLELRILAHLSNENKLLEALNSNEDVFKNIASKWKNITIVSVSNELRQQAKKICYGMIYGMSTISLAQQLNTTKEEASVFMETFKKTYPGLNKYFQSVIEKCQKSGYVTTLVQRRRYLPLINSQKKAERAHAERQAINTTIQGSAADIIKAAMIKIENELLQIYPETCQPFSSFLNSNSKGKTFRGGFLVLQMHDELIYEVNRSDLQTVLNIVQKEMETTTKLSVKLPVQVRFGTSWGSMTELS